MATEARSAGRRILFTEVLASLIRIEQILAAEASAVLSRKAAAPSLHRRIISCDVGSPGRSRGKTEADSPHAWPFSMAQG